MKKLLSFIALLFTACITYAQAPANTTDTLQTDTIQGEIVYKYTVERSVGLYRIGLNFNVSQEEIIRLNPQLKKRGLHYGETIYIPAVKRRVEALQPKIEANNQPQIEAKDTTIPSIDTTAQLVITPNSTLTLDNADSLVHTSPIDTIGKRVINLALMLPFESKQTKRSTQSKRMLEFYQGALLSLHNAQNDSTLYRLHVYDTERSERRVVELCTSNELDSMHGILGLAYPIQIEQMLHWCEEHQVPLLLPFNDDISISGHPLLYQFNSPDKVKADTLVQWIKERSDSLHCVVMDISDGELAQSVRTLQSAMRLNHIPYKRVSIANIVNDSLCLALDSTKQNLIILHTDKYSRAHILIPHIQKTINAGYDILLFGQYSWQQENIQIPLVFTSTFESTYTTEEYDQLWEHYFIKEPTSHLPRYDLLGYDMTNELIRIVTNDSIDHNLQSIVTWYADSPADGKVNSNIKVIRK